MSIMNELRQRNLRSWHELCLLTQTPLLSLHPFKQERHDSLSQVWQPGGHN